MRAQDEFWRRLEDVEAGMLGLATRSARFPVAPLRRDVDDGNIWFITHKAPAMVTPLTRGAQLAQFVVADGKSGLYGSLVGELALVDDPTVLAELWNPAIMAWLATTRDDAQLRLLCFKPQIGTVWYSSFQGITHLCAFQAAPSGEKPPSAIADRVG